MLIKKPRLKRGFLFSAYHLPVGEPGPAGASVEPLGEGLRWVFPDGFTALFRPAAALPASLLMPVLGLVPVALPVVVPPVEDPAVAPPVAVPPVPEPPPAEPPLDCANAKLLVKTSAVANPSVASFMIAPFCCIGSKRGPPAQRSCLPITVRCCSVDVARAPQVWNHSDLFVSIHN
jgi:hypothetical protein